MNVHTYKTTKSDKQCFIHVHFVIDKDHHIVEINDAMVGNIRFSRKVIKDAIFNNKAFDKYVFQADDEGFYTSGKMNPDIVVSGNVTDYDDPYSKFILEITDIDNVRSVVIKSTFNNKQVTTIIPIGSEVHKEQLLEMLHSILFALYSGFEDWTNECFDKIFAEV